MKRLLFITTLAFYFAAISCSRDNKAPGQRLENLLEAKHRLDIEKIPDYTYPNIFILASRNEIRDRLKKGLKNKDLNVRIDSLIIDSIYPVFKMKEVVMQGFCIWKE